MAKSEKRKGPTYYIVDVTLVTHSTITLWLDVSHPVDNTPCPISRTCPLSGIPQYLPQPWTTMGDVT